MAKTPSRPFNDLSLGILGGGQLARMLTTPAHQLGLKVSILSENDTEPAAQVARHWHRGKVGRTGDILRFAKNCDRITFESEFVPTKVLLELKKSPLAQRFFPSIDWMLTLQDRLPQKQWLDRNKIPTARWTHPKDFAASRSFAECYQYPIVVKSRFGGYDGYGTTLIKSARQHRQLKDEIDWPEVIIEEFIPFKRELAVQMGRSSKGDILVLPLVESFQKDSRCLWVKGPVEHKLSSALIRKMKTALVAGDYVGLLAFEIFDVGDQLIVNETAPRVHNSGHHSQNSLNIDQFELHLRCGLGMPLPKVKLNNTGFAMMNILGQAKELGPVAHLSEGHLHWYGKTENRKGRKMGHINVLDRTAAGALKKAIELRKKVKV